MNLFKNKEFNDKTNTFKLGPGLVFSEIHKFASENNRQVASGWGVTVGIIGWSTGGGHGPYSNNLGMGVDNIVEADVITSDGELLTVNSEKNSDLFWAIRGGGSGAFGIITSITIKGHEIQQGGYNNRNLYWYGDLCGDDLIRLE